VTDVDYLNLSEIAMNYRSSNPTLFLILYRLREAAHIYALLKNEDDTGSDLFRRKSIEGVEMCKMATDVYLYWLCRDDHYDVYANLNPDVDHKPLALLIDLMERQGGCLASSGDRKETEAEERAAGRIRGGFTKLNVPKSCARRSMIWRN
jgi:hypothetical protein